MMSAYMRALALERVCARMSSRHSRIGTPALMRNESRFANSVCSLVENRTNMPGCAAISFAHGAQHFLYGGLPRLRFHESVGEQGRHAVFLRYLPEVRGRNFLEDRFADLGPQDHHLVYADAAGVARAVAFFAASPAVKLRHVRKLPGKELACEALGLRRGQRIRFFAMAADAAHEALAYSHVHRRSDEVGVDSHIEEARQRRRGVARVERREDEVARERRIDGNRGGL